ncbi:z1226 protein [Yersinia mollaretii]|nr:z1226 protein [Yersinia mollaretii]
MQTEAEVLTEHNELICSTSIERIVTGRDNPHQQVFGDE